jgi:hypothetical protein
MRQVKYISALIVEPFVPVKNKRLEQASEDVLDALDVMIGASRDDSKTPSTAQLQDLKATARRVDDLIEHAGPSDAQYQLTPVGSNENMQALMQRAGFNTYDEVVLMRRSDFDAMQSDDEYRTVEV